MSKYTKTFRGATVKLPSPSALIREGSSAESLDWYADAGAECGRYATDKGHEVSHVADVLAITSPRVTVRRNCELAMAYLATGSTAGLLPSTRAALANWEASGRRTDAIRGDKTRSFSLAIQGDTSAVVVDVWTVRGLGLGGRNVNRGLYRKASATVRRLATRAGITPRAAQAALWYGTRARFGYSGGQLGIELR